ncbi:uncharacterized protein METZ01_LOCUS463823 [marine metagenome]|uniref:Uncharacterized protein n=1 Tax=marine metagenome TaxID=408172 RepID=A0A383ATV1_9ZZZZ|tara:strand:+ start:2254 stop:2430 length:177 start_codon:yes stop_codon:yes gene_type:complete
MNHALDQSRVKNSRESKASAYCRRNNINEYQFKKAVAWYRSAIKNSKKVEKTDTSLEA